jgi:hypothetical protein
VINLKWEVVSMGNVFTVDIPLRTIHKIQEVLTELEKAISPYKPEFLARMYRARASDLEGKGKSLAQIKRHFRSN